MKNDRASMLASLEMRAPFLDFRIIEFAFGKVPNRLKTNLTERKILLKRLCKKVLPPEFNGIESRVLPFRCRFGSMRGHGEISSPTYCWTKKVYSTGAQSTP